MAARSWDRRRKRLGPSEYCASDEVEYRWVAWVSSASTHHFLVLTQSSSEHTSKWHHPPSREVLNHLSSDCCSRLLRRAEKQKQRQCMACHKQDAPFPGLFDSPVGTARRRAWIFPPPIGPDTTIVVGLFYAIFGSFYLLHLIRQYSANEYLVSEASATCWERILSRASLNGSPSTTHPLRSCSDEHVPCSLSIILGDRFLFSIRDLRWIDWSWFLLSYLLY